MPHRPMLRGLSRALTKHRQVLDSLYRCAGRTEVDRELSRLVNAEVREARDQVDAIPR